MAGQPDRPGRKGKPRKQPFFVHRARRRPDGLAFAGLYEFWKDKTLPDDDPAAWLVTYTIITTAAEPGLDRLHDRMPVVLDRDRWAAWLDPAVTDPGTVRGLLRVARARAGSWPTRCRPWSTRCATTGPELLQPGAAPDELAGVVDPMTGEVIG